MGVCVSNEVTKHVDDSFNAATSVGVSTYSLLNLCTYVCLFL